MLKISKLQTLEPKYWSGLTTENHLGAIYQLEPQLLSNVVEHLYKVNLGSDDIVSFMDQFPTMYVDNDATPYEWLLQGSDERNIPLIKYTESDMSTVPTTAGLGRSIFYLHFPERYFDKTDVLVGHKPNTYALLVTAEPTLVGTNWAYPVQLVTGDDTLYVPAEELAGGTRWSSDYGLVTQTLSKSGNKVKHVSPFRMRNTLSMIRKEAEVPGNMIRLGKNKPMAFQFMDQNGKAQTRWISKLDWDMLVQFRRDRARLLMYGKSNLMPDGSYGNVGDSGYAIKAGFGLYEQMSTSNTFYYNTFSIDWLVDCALGLSYGKLPEDSRRFVLITGEYGAVQFHKAIEAKVGSVAYLDQSARMQYNGGKMSFGGQFTKYTAVNGISFEVMIDPMKDDPIRNKEYDTDGALLSSKEYELFDFGTAGGDSNIQKVMLKGDEEIFRYIPGLRSPFDPYNNLSTPSMTASKTDGYELHRAFIGGMRIKNPTRTARFIPSALR